MFHNYDMLYLFGNLKDKTFTDYGAYKINNTNLFKKIKEYLFKYVRIRENSEYIYPVKIDFHRRFGWIIYGNISKAYLGKCSINGKLNIDIGNRSYFSGTCNLNGHNKLSIGSYVSIAHGLEIFTSNINHPINFSSTFNLESNSRLIEDNITLDLPNFRDEINYLEKKNSITIDNDVWIGRNVMILPGTRISAGCVIGARTIITKDLEPYGVYVGSPARCIKFRFRKEIIEQLLEIKWWDWPLKKIKINKSFFNTDLSSYKNSILKLIK